MAEIQSRQQDLRKIPVIGLVPEGGSSAPTSPVVGQLWNDTSASPNVVRYWNGTSWLRMDQVGAELTSNKGATNGYAALVSGTVPIGQLPLGSSSTTVTVGNDARLADERTPLDNSVTSAKIVDGAIVTGDINAALKDAADNVTSLRQLGYTATKAMPGVARLDQIAAPTAAVSFGNQEITLVGTPSTGTSAANKTYVDNAVQNAAAGIDNKPSVRFGETTNRASLTGLSVDGGTRTDGDRVILLGQTTPSQNGPWIIHSGAWNRPPGETITAGAFWLITEGTLAGTQWKVATADPITLDSTSLSITQWGQGQTYSGTSGRITVSSGVIDIDAAYVGQTSITTLGMVATGTWNASTISIAKGGTGQTTAAAAIVALGGMRRFTQTLGALTAGVEVNVPHNLNTLYPLKPAFQLVSDKSYIGLGARVVDANTIAVLSDESYSTGTIDVIVVG